MGICKGCHPSVHTLHREKDIGCRVCHQSPRGWNSSIVEIPAPRKEDLVVVEGTEIAIPRSSDCGYCHLSARGAVRVHDVHKRIVENICPSCHSGGSTHRWVEVTDNAQEEEKGSSILLIEFLRLFEGISTNLQMLMTSL